MKKRIWGLDALRGLCILGMIAVHLIFDITQLYPLIRWNYPAWFEKLMGLGGFAFVVISGICVTLGSRSLRRGLIVFGCGMLCSLVTFLMAKAGPWSDSLIIYFGVLHCLGSCMLLWPLFKRLPHWALFLVGLGLAVLGIWFGTIYTNIPWLVVLGIRYPGFASSDYFPLPPSLGLFLMGAAMGKRYYRDKTTRLPRVNAQAPILRFLQFCGRHSLIIYLLHQPVLAGITTLIFLLTGGQL